MIETLAVFIGGGLGAVMRWRCQALFNNADGWPMGTFAVNIVGGFFAGICLALATKLTGEMRLFVVTGILGGLTTFSALSSEIIAIGLRGAVASAAIYGFATLVLGIGSCLAGYSLFR